MSLLEPLLLDCPYCGEMIELELDVSAGDQHYVEDCQVCCRPISVHVQVDDEDGPTVTLRHQDE